MHKRGDSNTSSITLVEPYPYRKSGYDDFVEVHAEFLSPSLMVVRAIKTYQPPLDAPMELRIAEGDFFHVQDYIDEIGNLGPWFDVLDPLTGERGLVLTRFVEEVHRSFKPVECVTIVTSSRLRILTSSQPSGRGHCRYKPTGPV
jgi:hypothetical protein